MKLIPVGPISFKTTREFKRLSNGEIACDPQGRPFVTKMVTELHLKLEHDNEFAKLFAPVWQQLTQMAMRHDCQFVPPDEQQNG